MLLVIKGKVDDWRNQRVQAWKIVEGFRGSKDMPDIIDFYPLPYDNEIKKIDQQQQGEALQEWYKLASKAAEGFKWN